MKYVVAWKPRAGGSAAENEASLMRALENTSYWTPSSDTAIHQFVSRIDGQGGFAFVESDNPSDLAETIFKFGTVYDCTVYPVIDFDEALRIARSRQVAR
jgi:Protein of unknown function (DUF3303)